MILKSQKRIVLKVENRRFAIRERDSQVGHRFKEPNGEGGGSKVEKALWRELRSTEVGDKRRRKRRGRGDGAKGLLERGCTELRLGVSRRNLQKYIGAQEGGSNRVSFSAARISTLSSADFTAFSGCLPLLYRPESRRIKISRSLLSN